MSWLWPRAAARSRSSVVTSPQPAARRSWLVSAVTSSSHAVISSVGVVGGRRRDSRSGSRSGDGTAAGDDARSGGRVGSGLGSGVGDGDGDGDGAGDGEGVVGWPVTGA